MTNSRPMKVRWTCFEPSKKLRDPGVAAESFDLELLNIAGTAEHLQRICGLHLANIRANALGDRSGHPGRHVVG